MNAPRRLIAMAAVTLLVLLGVFGAPASARTAGEVLHTWYKVTLELVRHTPTYTPPVASRSFAYLGVTAFEAVASGSQDLQSLGGQLHGLAAKPPREAGKAYDEAAVLNAALTAAVGNFFSNTGPTGQRVMTRVAEKLRAEIASGLADDVMARSEDYGKALASQILAWSRGDGGASIVNMDFPLDYTLASGPSNWVPTSAIALQQKPLVPYWGRNRTFAMPDGAACALPPPATYSEDKSSEFYKQALEVFETTKNLTPEQRTIARFWADDAMLSTTPPGHWVSIALQILARDNIGLERSADVLARVGIAEADAFIGCWNAKFQYDLLRPVTYIRRTMDAKWEPLLTTPPFPEYPSGHSTQSAAAATVLTQLFGDNFAFTDATNQRDGLAARSFPSFWAAANEAGISRLYGGIHFRAAIERGLDQGRCIGAHVNALKTWR